MNRLVLLDGNKVMGGLNLITPECYSTEERVVGCWIDGKPLYQKTIDFGALPNADQKAVAHNISNIDNIVNLFGVANNTNSNLNDFALPYIDTNSLQNGIGLYINSTNITIRTGSDRSGLTAFIIIQYTKTTDTAGSGTWTPSGIPAVHYSTEEHVIGTWIDGSTLYEKTITIAALPSNTEAVEYTISNETINLLSYEGTVTFTSGNKASLPYTNIAPDAATVDNIKSAIINTQINANGKFWIRCGRDRSNCSAIITVRYTKSS